jgi:hypothetical protein
MKLESTVNLIWLTCVRWDTNREIQIQNNSESNACSQEV